MASFVVGNLVAAFIFEAYDLVTFYLLMGIFSLVSALMFAFLRKPIKVLTAQELPIMPVVVP